MVPPFRLNPSFGAKPKLAQSAAWKGLAPLKQAFEAELAKVATNSLSRDELERINKALTRLERYWTDQIAQTSDFHKSEVLDYIVSKFGRFITNTMMRNIIGQHALDHAAQLIGAQP